MPLLPLSIVFLLLACQTTALALPQFALLSGNRCSNCHVAPAGGGARSDLGWYAWQDVSIVPRTSSALAWAYDGDESNAFFDDKLLLGLDARVQSTRSAFSTSAPRTTFPMQATLYAVYRATDGLTAEAQFNVAALRKAPNSDRAIRFPGQRPALFSVMYVPDTGWPMIRAGMFRPSYGMRYDDHTTFPYSIVTATSRQNIVAPDWGEWGAEVTYESLRWLTVSAGVFGSEGLSQLQLAGTNGLASAVTSTSPTVVGRAVVHQKFLESVLTSYVGASALVNGEFRMYSAFAGIGWQDNLALMLDVTQADIDSRLTSTNVMAELMWQLATPVFPYVRYETGISHAAAIADADRPPAVSSIVLGTQLFVIPYVELRPEYRIWDTDLEGYVSRWNLQLHLFY